MPPPEHYDTFDPDAHDLETERLERLAYQHWLNDLRNLQSEADAERTEARRSAKPTSSYRAIMEAFKEMEPEPPRRNPEAHAEWEWRRLAFLYAEQDNEYALARHHLARGSFIERHASFLRDCLPPDDPHPTPSLPPKPVVREKFVPIPWPDGDGVSEWREQIFATDEPEDIIARQEPSYDRSVDLESGTLGWFRSLEEEDRAPSELVRTAMKDCARKVQQSFEQDYSPGNIGEHLLHMRRGLEHGRNALELLEACRGYTWLTPAAYERLRELVEAVLDAGEHRYAEMQATYDGYLERAYYVLGGTKWEPPVGEDTREE